MSNEPAQEHRVINNRKKLKWIVGVLKKEGLKIGYTSGVYDMLHDGHVEYLAAIKKLCDVLIVGVDDDELTRIRKPNEKNRPIDGIDVRLKLLVHNRSTNIVCTRSSKEHPDKLIRDILPDIAVFSYGSEKDRMVFEKRIRDALTDYVGDLVFLEPMSSNSTTSKIRRVSGNGSNELAQHLQKEFGSNVNISKKLEKAITVFFTFKENGG
jgi:cytidyltransferase-like protein